MDDLIDLIIPVDFHPYSGIGNDTPLPQSLDAYPPVKPYGPDDPALRRSLEEAAAPYGAVNYPSGWAQSASCMFYLPAPMLISEFVFTGALSTTSIVTFTPYMDLVVYDENLQAHGGDRWDEAAQDWNPDPFMSVEPWMPGQP